MLSYCFRILNKESFKKMDFEDFDNVGDLLAAILTKGISYQIKRGLGKAYIENCNEMSSLRGKIELSESLKSRCFLNRRLVCSYDDLSNNYLYNQIIKSSVTKLLKTPIKKEYKKSLRKLMIYFKDVEIIDLNNVDWHMRFDRNNESYRMLIYICYLVKEGMIQTEEDGSFKMMNFIDERRMSTLYGKFILEYYKKHFPSLSPCASQVPWAEDNDNFNMLPIMQTDIFLKKDYEVLIIDAKYYENSVQTYFGKASIHSNNIYQIFTYVKNCSYDVNYKNYNVSGMLLYAKTDNGINPNSDYVIHGNKISAKSLDLSENFESIREKLDKIVEDYFKDVQKENFK